jgi:E3 ubiquitin-protein ligase HUWE1
VTPEKVNEYVEAYLRWTLKTAVDGPFEAFEKGCRSVCGRPIYQRFTAEELDLLVSGAPVADWEDVKAATEYEGYARVCESVAVFWDVFDSLAADQKRRLLELATGSPRMPVAGRSTAKLRISCAQNVQQGLTAYPGRCTLTLPDVNDHDGMRQSVAAYLKRG